MMYATKSARAHYRKRVLCVDDNELAVFVNATILESEGYEVLASSDPLQAASIAKSEELDLAILDYEMPNMNGAELAAFCKAANPEVKVILFSGPLGIPRRELAFADRLVEKSDGVEVLLEAIETLLARNKAPSRISTIYHNNGMD
jgi:CheY-like chemotaxis protein